MTEETQSLYEVLGVEPDATADEIKAAHRDLAKRSHPDQEMGDNEVFLAVQEAYEVLSDPDRRAHYDSTGTFSTGSVDEGKALVLSTLAMMFSGLLDSKGATFCLTHDLKAELLRSIERSVEKAGEQIADAKGKIPTLIQVRERVTRKDDGPNPFFKVIDDEIKAIHAGVAVIADRIDLLDKCQKELDNFDCKGNYTGINAEPRYGSTLISSWVGS